MNTKNNSILEIGNCYVFNQDYLIYKPLNKKLSLKETLNLHIIDGYSNDLTMYKTYTLPIRKNDIFLVCDTFISPDNDCIAKILIKDKIFYTIFYIQNNDKNIWFIQYE